LWSILVYIKNFIFQWKLRGVSVASSLRKIVGFIPKNKRLELFMDFYRECGSNSRETAKILGISIRRVYFYLPNKKNNKVRNYPNDETTYLVLKAFLKKNPKKTFRILKRLHTEFGKLQTKVFFKGIYQEFTKLYDIMV